VDGHGGLGGSRRYENVWWVFLLVCLCGVVAYQLTPPGVGQDVLYVGFGLASAAAIVAGVRMHHPAVPAAWYLMAAGQLLASIADALFSWIAYTPGEDTFPTVADAVYLAAYPFLAAGLFLLIRARWSPGDVGSLLDSAILTAALGLLLWVLLAGPAIDSYQQSWLAAAVAVAYPVADVVLLGMLMAIVTGSGGRAPAVRLLVLAIVALIAVDLAATALDLLTFESTESINFLWLVSYSLWGAAALHPSMRELSEPTDEVSVGFSLRRLAALTAALLVAPGIMIVQEVLHTSVDTWPIAIGSIIMSLLVVARIRVAFDQISTAHQERSKAQAALAHEAAHDHLTGLPNRAQAMELITAALSRANRTGARVALLFLDLDGFKRVNDAFGHGAGDELLQVVAQRLRANVRVGDVACRLGGDEFIVLLEDVPDDAEALGVAHRLIPVLSAPIVVAGHRTVTVGASVGVAFNHDSGTDPDVLLQEADAAVYRAKRSGRGRVEVFDAEMRVQLLARSELERELSTAIHEGHLVLHYQPVVHLASGAVQGYEALVRWPRDGGLLAPSEFVPVAEQSELICELGAWVLQEATRQLAEWNQRTSTPWIVLAVNISGRHLSRPRVLTDVRSALVRAGIDPTQLVLEITETALTDGTLAVRHLEQLRHDGIAVSIDDFGTGYSSIARLEHLPVDILKVDRRFLDQTAPSSERLLRLIVQTGQALNLGVIAEGVETPEQAALLGSIGCKSAQGYLLGRPIEPAAIVVPERRSGPPLRSVGAPGSGSSDAVVPGRDDDRHSRGEVAGAGPAPAR